MRFFTRNLKPAVGLPLLTVLSLVVSFSITPPAGAQLIRTVDYQDTFTLGTNGRANGIFGAGNIGAYVLENSFGNPASTWTPQDTYSFNDIPGSFGSGPTVLAASTGNPGAAGGIAQSGGGDFSFAYGLRTSYVVQMDAFVSPGDRTDISSVPSAGAGIFSSPSISVFFRRDSLAGSPSGAFPLTGLPGIGIYNGAVETAVTDAGGNLIKIGVNDDNWHSLAVHFDQDNNRLRIYVDHVLKANLDLTTFGGGAYQNYSNGAVGAGGAGAFVDGKVLWFDNFQVGEANPALMEIVDYEDTFTLGTGGRANGVCCAPAPYLIENSFGNPDTTWTPQNVYSFNDIPGSFGAGPTVLAAATGNPGAAGGIAQTGGGDFSIAYGLRTNYVVQVDAFISPGDRTDISSMPSAGGGIFSAPSLSVFLRRDSIAGTPHPAFPISGLPGIGIFNSAVETAVTDAGGNAVKIGVDDDNWHNLAVHFNQDDDRLIIYVDGRVVADLDLATFAGGIYQNYSNGAVGAGGAGAFVDGKVLWFDNFRVGGFPGLNACFTSTATSGVSPLSVEFDSACTTGAAGPLTVTWDFGDGATAAGESVEHEFASGGFFTVTLTVDDGINTSMATRAITVFEARTSFSDNFNRPDGPIDGWTVYTGNWALSGNRLTAGPSAGEFWIWAGSPAYVAPANSVFEFDYEFLAPGNFPDVGRHGGFQFHCTRPTARGSSDFFSGYFIDWIDRPSDRGVRLSRRDPGGFVSLTTGQGAAAPANPPLHYRVEVDGSRIRVFGDGVKYIDIVDATYRGGHFGFWTWEQGQQVAVDNLTFQGQALTPCFTVAPAIALSGSPLTFDASCSSVFGGGSAIVSYDWDFGDSSTGSGAVVGHTYAAAGQYTAVLTVEDDIGATASLSKAISVGDNLFPFRDCFDRSPGPVAGWSPVLGTWAVTASQRMQTGSTAVAPDGESWNYAGSPAKSGSGDMTAEFDVPSVLFVGSPADGVKRHFGAIFYANELTTNRFSGTTTGYTFWWIDRVDDFGLSLARWDNGALTILQSGTGALFAAPPKTYRIETEGSRIRLFGDGVLAIDVEDDTYREGYFGFWIWKNMSIQFDNVRIWQDSEPLKCGTTFHLAGDCDSDGARDISDIICYIKTLFPGFFLLDRNRPTPPCSGDPLTGANNLALSDINGDGRIDLSEPIYLARYLFAGGPPPVQGAGCIPMPPEAGCTDGPSCP